jgi:hypothetical protein
MGIEAVNRSSEYSCGGGSSEKMKDMILTLLPMISNYHDKERIGTDKIL